jgi:hypothetical protein
MHRRARALSRLALGCVVVFGVLELISMRLYPGGTWWDRSTQGARFWQNFICDLESDVSLNGHPNAAGARVAEIANWVIVVGLFAFWSIVPRLFPNLRRTGSAVRISGFASLAGIVAVGAMPSQRFGALHGVAVIVTGAPGLTAAFLAVAGLARAEARPRTAAVLGAAMLAFALVDFTLYTHTMLRGGPGPPLLPVAQKVALLFLLAWMSAVAWRTARISTETSR